jgi:hypothetical protein
VHEATLELPAGYVSQAWSLEKAGVAQAGDAYRAAEPIVALFCEGQVPVEPAT